MGCKIHRSNRSDNLTAPRFRIHDWIYFKRAGRRLNLTTGKQTLTTGRSGSIPLKNSKS